MTLVKRSGTSDCLGIRQPEEMYIYTFFQSETLPSCMFTMTILLGLYSLDVIKKLLFILGSGLVVSSWFHSS